MEGRKEKGQNATRTTSASSLAGGVKGDVSLLLGDQCWPGKISSPKPAKENLPACPLHPSLHLSVQLPFLYNNSVHDVVRLE